MERVAIILRKSHAINRFREIILRAFQEPDLNELLLCSGFFQDRTNYQASACFAASAPNLPCQKQLTSVGLYNMMWRSDYDSFISGLRSITCPCGRPVNVEKRRVKKYHWHAKVFIAKKHSIPVLGIIGSSNITSRAFGTSAQWNYEADVVLWNDGDSVASSIISGVLGSLDDNDPFSVVVSDYASEDPLNRGLSLEQRLLDLHRQIIDVSEVVE
ncbi:MAG: hypothetical protein M0R47_17395 [Methylobacter sp.]|jgi:hypothetical protein|uniref:hypothetical protein n=1 Tax=Methylobacter sp. TaxID=2051955 RepID=UPI0025F1C355|nr:hypothetical protein [Methylobacter sp.]MCK9622300.1 hypothetical protein [Methylobacter sp.]